MELERRIYETRLRIERRAEGGTPVLVGHAAVFNAASLDLGGFREICAPGAFAQTVAEDDIRALFNHDANMILGRNRSQTLRLREDPQGLAYEIDLPDTQYARDLIVSVERGDITGNSFSFRTIEDRWEEREAGVLRTLLKVQLNDVSPVTYPAYPQTDLALRSLEAWKAEQKAVVQDDPLDRRFDILVPGTHRA